MPFNYLCDGRWTAETEFNFSLLWEVKCDLEQQHPSVTYEEKLYIVD